MKPAFVALISAVVTSLFWLAGLVIAYFYFFGTSPPFQVTVQAPQNVSIEDPVEITVNITNPSAKEMVLDSMDVYSSLLEGFDLVSVHPPPSRQTNLLNFRSFSFSRSVAPDETLAVVFSLKAKQNGYFGGDIDVCTPAQKFTTVSTGITVRNPNE